MNKKDFTFIDLFAGIGGFHQAASSLGGKCVFASEIDKYALDTYKQNYGIDANHDITKVDEKEIPKHDLLCAGFPCQSFSKAGHQKGMDDTRGTLFFDIKRILKYHKTKYILLENVRNLVSHDHGNTWKIIRQNLHDLGYRLTEEPLILSPHQFGVPQLRERVYILGIYDPKHKDLPLEIKFDGLKSKEENSIYDIIEKNRVESKYYITEYETKVLTAWDEFYSGIKNTVLGFPVWADVFMNKYVIKKSLPKWKQEFVRKNQNLYEENKTFIDEWLKKYNYLSDFRPTHKKFEWQANSCIKSLWDGIIQFRPSGIRVKKPNSFPALVAMVQIPIIGKYKRRLTMNEVARLQSFPDSFIPNSNNTQAYKQFGNSVNIKILENLIYQLLFK